MSMASRFLLKLSLTLPRELRTNLLKFATFPDSSENLQDVSIGVAVSEPVTEMTYIALDDVVHVNYS